MNLAARLANGRERVKGRVARPANFYLGDATRWMIGVGLAVGIGLSLAVLLPPLAALPSDPAVITRVAGVVLQAQAAMMAISLAVMAFIVGGVQRRRDVDDPLYEWFLDRARIRPVFALSAWSLLGTGAAFFLAELGIGQPNPNLLLFAGGSIGASIFSTVGFALWALRTLQPSRYREYKRVVTIDQVQRASARYAREVIRSESPDLRHTIWARSEGRAADRALERIVDDAERTIRDGRFVDFRDSIDLLRDCVSVAIEEGSPDPERLSPFVTKAHFSDWPIRRPLSHGLYRLRTMALAGGRPDYANLIHVQSREWLSIGTVKQHLLLVDLAIALLRDEYRLTQRFSGSANLSLDWSIKRLIRVAFEHLIAVADGEELEVSDAARYELSIDLIGLLQEWAGDLLDRGEVDPLAEWLDQAGNYMGVMSWEDTEAHRLGVMMHSRRPSLMSHLRLAVAAIAGRALQHGNDAALDLWVNEMDYGAPPAFPVERVTSDMALLNWTPALAVLDESWKQWLQADISGSEAPFSKSNRYPLMAYLWLAARENSIRAVPPEGTVVADLRQLYRRHRRSVLERVSGDESRRLEVDEEIWRWLGPPLPR